VLDNYREQDVVEGRVAKVVTFGAFVEILPGVEGLVHISELAPHHVENPREVVSQGDPVNVLILEIDGERRRLSLSLKRVEEGEQPVPRADGAESVHVTPDLRLTEEAFPTGGATVAEPEVLDETEIVEGEVAEDAEDADEPAASADEPEEISDENEESEDADELESSEDGAALAEARASSDDADQSA